MNLSTTDPDGRLTRYGYYADGCLKTPTGPNGNLTTVERDTQHHLMPPFCANLCMLYMRHAI